MIEFFFSIDKAIFVLGNVALANPVFDVFMPILTDLNQAWYGRTLFAILWLLLIWKGGKKGRIVGLLLIPLIIMSDQLSSNVLKQIFARPRPCHEVNGVMEISDIHLLVPCGSGYSFPSSHAVNNFAAATLFSYYYRNWKWLAFALASLVAFSRIAVGVHYPSDVLGGSCLGVSFAFFIIFIWRLVERHYPQLLITPGNSFTSRSSVEE